MKQEDETEFYKRHRPTSFEDVVGSATTVAALEAWLEKGTLPHAILITGESGSGKTTLARIIRDRLNCSPRDFKEVNASNERGVDTIRTIHEGLPRAPMKGKVRIIFFDECFHKDTLVKTTNGETKISDVNVGDLVFNVEESPRQIKHVFKNKVSLDRIVKVLAGGAVIYTTKEHLFLTSRGWIPAINLKKTDCIFRNTSHDMDYENLSKLPNDVSTKVQKQQAEMLFQIMFSKIEKSIEWTGANRSSELCFLSNFIHGSKSTAKNILQSIVPCEAQTATTRISSKILRRTSQQESLASSKKICQNSKRERTEQTPFLSDDLFQSSHRSECDKESISNERSERDTAQIFGQAWGKWTRNRTSEETPKVTSKLGFRMCSVDSSKTWIGLPQFIQNRYSETVQENWNRSGRSWTSLENKFIKGCQEDKTTRTTRVESVEVYQQGSNDESFESAVSDSDRLQGFVEFYDLEVDGHPSYYANGVLVHNCHKQTNPAQNAALKMMEDTPSHIYFIGATTNPEMLIKAFRSRFTPLPLTRIDADQMENILQRVCKLEKVKLTPNILEAVVQASDGNARSALVMLEKISVLPPAQQKAAIEEEQQKASESITLCRALIDGKEWPKIVEILNGLQGQPEDIRRHVLGYAKSCLQKPNPAQRAYLVISCFGTNFYDSGAAGLTYACYEACKGE